MWTASIQRTSHVLPIDFIIELEYIFNLRDTDTTDKKRAPPYSYKLYKIAYKNGQRLKP